jgi:hypothetical protein
MGACYQTFSAYDGFHCPAPLRSKGLTTSRSIVEVVRRFSATPHINAKKN